MTESQGAFCPSAITPTEHELPPEGVYVLAHHTRDTHHDPQDKEGCRWVVVKLVRGISLSDRKALPQSSRRKHTWMPADEQGDNQRPYIWRLFGSGTFRGQEIDKWCHLPRNQS